MSERPRRLGPLAAALLALGVVGARWPAGGAGAPPAGASAASCSELTPAVLRGRRIFHRGVTARGEPVEGALGGGAAVLRGDAVACAGCHAHDGAGAAEGGVAAPPITPERLFAAQPARAAYTPEALATAIREGRTPASRALHLVMPRYRLGEQDLGDLVAYLRCLGRDAEPGVTPEAIRLGAALPLTGRFAAAGAAARDVLSASFDELNEGGGVYRRRLELVVADSGESLDGARATERLLDQGVFALVGSVWGADVRVAERLEADGVPLLGPLGTVLPSHDPGDGVVFHLQPALDTLARVAVKHVAGSAGGAGARSLLVVHPHGPEGDGWLRGARAEASARGLPEPVSRPFEPGRFDARGAVAAAVELGARAVLLAGDGAEIAAWLAISRSPARPPDLYVPAPLLRHGAEVLQRAAPGRVLLVHPGAFDEGERRALEELSGFLERRRVAPRSPAFQASAYAASRVVVEALKRAGARLTRPGLIAALEGLRDFDPGPGPAVSFGKNRRIGMLGATVVGVDPASGGVLPLSGWIDVVP